jgi:hypothetical protein
VGKGRLLIGKLLCEALARRVEFLDGEGLLGLVGVERRLLPAQDLGLRLDLLSKSGVGLGHGVHVLDAIDEVCIRAGPEDDRENRARPIHVHGRSSEVEPVPDV